MMLLEIYYSGALTMFFSTKAAIPFETMRQVIQAYPDWKLEIPPFTEAFFNDLARGGDPDYVKFWERLQNFPEETYFDFDLQRLREEPVVVFAIDIPLRAHMIAYPGDLEGLHTFDKGTTKYCNLIVTDNSPLGPVLKYGAQRILETGEKS